MAGQTANDVLADLTADYKKQQIPIGAHTTDGIYSTLDYQQAQINALADYIDGKRTTVTVTPPAKPAAAPAKVTA